MISKVFVYILIFVVGVSVGIFLMALFAVKSDANEYEEGFRDGYQQHKGEELDNFTEICSHCAYRGI